jgi:hypothetical protein
MTSLNRGRALRASLLLASLAAFPCFADAQPQAHRPRASVAAAGGVFRPSEQVFRDVYGGSEATWLVQVDASITGPIGVFGGVRRLSRDGRTVVEPDADLAFDTTLDVTSVRFGARAGGRVGPVLVTGRFGADYNTGDEEWPDLRMSTSFDAWGWLAQGSIEVPLWKRVAAIGLIELTRATVDTGRETSTQRTQIGGITFAAGISLGF